MNICTIRAYLSRKKVSKVIIIYNGSRNQKIRYEGILFGIYNNVFTIRDGENKLKCFNYRDILTKTIHLYI